MEEELVSLRASTVTNDVTTEQTQDTVAQILKQLEFESHSVAHAPQQYSDLIRDLIKLTEKKVEKNANVSFMTTKDREMFPTKMPQNRFGNEISPLRGAPHRAPGCYENEEKTSLWYEIEHQILSQKGYTLGARTGSRFAKENVYEGPSPTAYQTTCTDMKEFDTSEKPFLVGADRFPVYRRDLNEVLPGPGVYEHNVKSNKKVQWHQSFGGTPIQLPTIQIRSTIDQNTEKLYSTKEEKKYNRKLAYLKLYY